MKSAFKIILAVLLLAGGSFMLNGCGGVRYEQYSHRGEQLNMDIDYISGWTYQERSEPDNNVHVVFIEPKKDKDDFSARISLTAKASAQVKLDPLTIETLAQDLLVRRLKLAGAKELSKTTRKLLGTQAIDIQLAYQALNKLYDINAKMVPVKERIIIFEKNQVFYTLIYLNQEGEFARFDKGFYHCVNSLKVK